MYNNFVFGMVAGISAFSSMIGIAACVCVIIGMWKCFIKAGKPGWHAVVPFLNIYTLFEIAWTKKTGIAVIVLEAAGIFFYIIGGIMVGVSAYTHGFHPFTNWEFVNFASVPGAVVVGYIIFAFAGIAMAVAAILTCVCYVKLGQSFGKRGGFNVGLFFVAPVFLMILGLGRDQYIGTPYRQATGPYVSPNQGYYQQNDPNQNYYQQNGQNQGYYQQNGPTQGNQGKTVCPHCGKPEIPGSKFCSNCGGPLA